MKYFVVLLMLLPVVSSATALRCALNGSGSAEGLLIFDGDPLKSEEAVFVAEKSPDVIRYNVRQAAVAIVQGTKGLKLVFRRQTPVDWKAFEDEGDITGRHCNVVHGQEFTFEEFASDGKHFKGSLIRCPNIQIHPKVKPEDCFVSKFESLCWTTQVVCSETQLTTK